MSPTSDSDIEDGRCQRKSSLIFTMVYLAIGISAIVSTTLTMVATLAGSYLVTLIFATIFLAAVFAWVVATVLLITLTVRRWF